MSKKAPRRRPARLSQSAEAVDIHVGARIRMRRRFIGMSQQTLAETLRLTFQQVQKYERGSNRVSASKLYEIARALGVGSSYFFEGLADPLEGRPAQAPAAGPGADATREFLFTAEGLELARLFPRLRNAELRRQLILLVRAAAHSEGADPDARP